MSEIHLTVKKLDNSNLTSEIYLTVKKLDISNLTHVLHLQQKIINGLQDNEQHFILRRTKEDYENLLNGKNTNILGVFDDNKMIAQAVFETPSNQDTRSMPEFKSDIPNENLVIFEAILVDPDYRGSGLMKKMLDIIEKNFIDDKRTHSIIQIAIDNPASWINALHHGMSITKVDLDPYDGCKVIYLEKKINQQQMPLKIEPIKLSYSMHLGNNFHKKIPCLFAKMKHLIGKGCIGVGLDKETNSLIWQKEKTPQRQLTATQMMLLQTSERVVS